MRSAEITDEIRKFETLVKGIGRDIRKLAASCDGEFASAGTSKKILRAIDYAYDLGRFQTDPMAAYARIEGLNAARRFACRESGMNLKAARYAELARLDAVIREKRFEARINNGW